MKLIAFVTGGTRGIGAAISSALQHGGYAVAATYFGDDEVAKNFSRDTGVSTYKWSVSNYDSCVMGIKKS